MNVSPALYQSCDKVPSSEVRERESERERERESYAMNWQFYGQERLGSLVI